MAYYPSRGVSIWLSLELIGIKREKARHANENVFYSHQTNISSMSELYRLYSTRRVFLFLPDELCLGEEGTVYYTKQVYLCEALLG